MMQHKLLVHQVPISTAADRILEFVPKEHESLATLLDEWNQRNKRETFLVWELGGV